VDANGTHPSGTRHAHVIEGVPKVGSFGGRGRVAERGEAASERRWVGLLLDRVIAVDRRADEVSDASATELPSNNFAITGGDDAEGDPGGDQSL
jgi:hypothetical protein